MKNNFDELAQILKEAPGYFLTFVLGIVATICAKQPITALALGSIFLGLATNLWIALAVFFLLSTAIMTANHIVGSLTAMTTAVTRAIQAHGAMITSRMELPHPHDDNDPST